MMKRGCGVAVVAIAMCSSMTVLAQDAPGPSPEPQERFFELLIALSTPISGAGGDCDKVAETVVIWCDSHGAEMKTVATEMEERFASFDAEKEKVFTERFSPIAETLMGAALECAEHTKTREAFKHMDQVLGVE